MPAQKLTDVYKHGKKEIRTAMKDLVKKKNAGAVKLITDFMLRLTIGPINSLPQVSQYLMTFLQGQYLESYDDL